MARTEEEELEVIKEWWERNGKPILLGCVLALVGIFGWQYWQKHQTGRTEAASMIYQQLLEAALDPSGTPNAARVVELAGQLKKDFSGSHYAQYASLFVAKVAVDNGELSDAAAELQAVLDKPADATLAEMARQRLARVLSAQGKTEEALALLEGDADEAFQAGREELRGDLLVKLGRIDEARAAYQKAESVLPNDAAAGVLHMKLDDLGGEGA